MRKVYFLSTCDTCHRIMKDLNLEGFLQQDIKKESLTASQLEELYQLAGSYEGLFSKVARKYRSLGLNEKDLSESDFRAYLLEEYTFLKRPVFVVDGDIFVGNSKKTVAALAEKLNA